MIDDLAARREHWDDPRNRAPRDEHDLTDSMPYPFLSGGVEDVFIHQDVLEIGPGRGRQYERLRPLVRSYAVADVSPAALAEPVFAALPHRFLIEDYGDDFSHRWDVVHFWYVLHHVRASELAAFLGLAARHLRPGGHCLFNTPQAHNAPEWYTGDGLGTTWMDRAVVTAACEAHLEVDAVVDQDERSSGTLFVTRKR